MKLSTFIKAYKIALSSITDITKEFDEVFLTRVSFENSLVIFTFCSSHDMKPGSMCCTGSVDGFRVERAKLPYVGEASDSVIITLNKSHIALQSKINDTGRVYAIFELICLRKPELLDSPVSSIQFDFDKDLLKLRLSDSVIVTNGLLI